VESDPFDCSGFTFRYNKDLFVKNKKYLNIIPRKKSAQTIRDKIREYLRKNGHKNPTELVKGLNPILKGWMNYYSIPKVSYPQLEKRKLRWYMMESLHRYYRRKSQRKSKLYRKNAFEELTSKYGLVDPSKYSYAN